MSHEPGVSGVLLRTRCAPCAMASLRAERLPGPGERRSPGHSHVPRLLQQGGIVAAQDPLCNLYRALELMKPEAPLDPGRVAQAVEQRPQARLQEGRGP